MVLSVHYVGTSPNWIAAALWQVAGGGGGGAQTTVMRENRPNTQFRAMHLDIYCVGREVVQSKNKYNGIGLSCWSGAWK